MGGMSAVIPKGITGQKPSHDRRDGNCAGPEQEVKLIGNKCPGIVRRRRISVSFRIPPIRDKKLSLSALSSNICLLSMPLAMMWWRAPGASIRDFLGMQTE